MNEEQAEAVAKALGGETWESVGDIWLVIFRRSDGKISILSDEAIFEYNNDEAFDNNAPSAYILLH